MHDVEREVRAQVEATPDRGLRPVEVDPDPQNGDLVTPRGTGPWRYLGTSAPAQRRARDHLVEEGVDAHRGDDRLERGPHLVIARAHGMTVPALRVDEGQGGRSTGGRRHRAGCTRPPG